MITPLLIERDGAIATVTLNNPANANALTVAAWRRLGGAMHDLAADVSLRCVVLRGAGDRAFSVGADVAEFADVCSSAKQARDYSAVVRDALDAVATCRHPTLALIQGACQSEGLALAAVCDLRICSEASRFSLPGGRFGIPLGPEALAAIRRVAGLAATLEMLLEGGAFSGAEAYRRRLVNRVAAATDAEAYAIAGRIAAGAPLAARWNKQFIARLAVGAAPAGAELDQGWACFDTDDYATGLAALMKGTKPGFKGR